MTDAPRRRRPGGLPFGSSHPVHLRARIRQAEAVRLRGAGWSLAAIAEHLGYASRQGAHEAIRSARTHASPSVALRMEEAQLDAARLDKLLVAVLPAAFTGRMSYIRAAIGLIELRQRVVRALSALRAEVQGPRP
ncbi:hypothetical protein [Neoroseomonas lacus]|uniref:Uncharacterized protein n=1 Tax=Neoroseomonas lacus TaxID=287609 RepID=A0A917NSD6_9PROT|nr:hypothetical protein [Neoroseomonas lacus]GGJ25296.1 hypothetical protein GCM10011320_35840 [Neoroseomonas lacus]